MVVQRFMKINPSAVPCLVEEGTHRAWTPSQACPCWSCVATSPVDSDSVLSACGNDKGRIRLPSGQGNLEEEKTDTNHPCLRTVSIEM